MSKGSRARNKDKRANEKKARKAARKQLYAKYAADGRVKGSKRSRSKVKLIKTKKTHPTPCGNPGCKKCYPQYK
jgi:hypothetical protein